MHRAWPERYRPHPRLGLPQQAQKRGWARCFRGRSSLLSCLLICGVLPRCTMRTSELQRIHPPVAPIDEHRRGLDRTVLHQDRGLLELFAQGVSVIRMAMEGPRTHDQVALERAGNARLDAEFVGCSGLALADTVAPALRQRSTTPSSDSLKACLRYRRLIMMRSGTRGRPAWLKRSRRCTCSPNRSRSGMAMPERALRDNRCATDPPICCQGMREASTASGWRRSIM